MSSLRSTDNRDHSEVERDLRAQVEALRLGLAAAQQRVWQLQAVAGMITKTTEAQMESAPNPVDKTARMAQEGVSTFNGLPTLWGGVK